MSYDPNNLFARIVRGDIPSIRVHEDAERAGHVLAQVMRAGGHLLLADEEALVVALVPLPRQAALQQKQQGVRQRLQVVPPAGGAPQVGVHAGVANRAPEHVRALVVLHVRGAHRILPPRRKAQVHQEQLSLLRRPGGTQQEVLRLDVPVHVALGVERVQNRQRLHGDAGHHVLGHGLPVLVPRVPQARAQQVHHLRR